MLKQIFSGVCAAVLISSAAFAQTAPVRKDTRLAEAAMQGDRDGVRVLVGQKADVNSAQGDGMTALHWAALKGDVAMADMLLKAGATVKATTRIESLTPLYMACNTGNAPMVELLLKAGADPNAANVNGTTVLMTAAASGNADAVRMLIEHGADVNAKETTNGQTALMFAAALNRGDAIKVLLAHGADPKITTKTVKFERILVDANGDPLPKPGENGAKPAAAADKAAPAADKKETGDVVADTGTQKKLQADAGLPEKTPAPNARDYDPAAAGGGRAAAAAGGRGGGRGGRGGAFADRVFGAQVQGGMTALHFAAREGQMDAVRQLVAGGADVNEQSAAEKYPPITMAIINAHYDVAKYLLDHGADPRIANADGLTPLYATVDMRWRANSWYPQPTVDQEKTNYLDLMRELLVKGADPNARMTRKLWYRKFRYGDDWVDPNGGTAFWRAAQANDVAAMKLLKDAGADPKIAPKNGVNALLVAAGVGFEYQLTNIAPDARLDALKYLVEECGFDVNSKDEQGYTALHGLGYVGDNDSIKYLVSKGANPKARSQFRLGGTQGGTPAGMAQGDTTADMANGPREKSLLHPDTVALLESLGSENSHFCRSTGCVNNTIPDKKPAADGAKPASKDATKDANKDAAKQ